jgi:hypothetical protein
MSRHPRRCLAVTLCTILPALHAGDDASAQQLIPVVNNLDSPVFATTWPGNNSVIVVAERAGATSGGSPKIRRFEVVWALPPSTQPPTLVGSSTILDLGGIAYRPQITCSEFIGLTGFAFHPEFNTDPDKRFFYVRYNEVAPSYAMVIVRYVIPPGRLTADPASATVIYTHAITQSGHGSGQIHFDTVDDGQPNSTRMYFTMPDDATNSATCSEFEIVQTDSSHLGKLWAIDVEGAGPYPLTMLGKGLRNPFGFSVDRGDGQGQGLGDVWIGNPGRETTGDIFRWVAGTGGVENYGWPWRFGDWALPDIATVAWEIGSICPEPSPPPTYVPRPYETVVQAVTGGRDALLGGYVYRGTAVPSLTDKYVFGVFGNSGQQGPAPRVLSIDADNPSGSLTVTDVGLSLTPSEYLFGLGQDSSGELFVIGCMCTNDVGTLYKIIN